MAQKTFPKTIRTIFNENIDQFLDLKKLGLHLMKI